MPNQLNIQPDFQTPKKLCYFILNQLSISETDVVLEPTPGLGNFTKIFDERKINYITPKNDFFKEQFTTKFDLIIANPPFSPMILGYEIFERCFNHLLKDDGKMAIILPVLFLINSTRRMRRYFPHITKIIFLDRTVFKGSRVQTAIFFLTKKTKIEKTICLIYEKVDEEGKIID